MDALFERLAENRAKAAAEKKYDAANIFFRDKGRQNPASHVPGALEMQALLKQGEGVKTSFFQQQVNALLRALSVDYDQASRSLEGPLTTLRSMLKALKPRSLDKKITPKELSFVLLHSEGELSSNASSLDYVPPSGFNVVGSYALQVLPPSNQSIDIAVEMPPETFGDAQSAKKIYLNWQYRNRRSLYVAETFRQLQQMQSNEQGFRHLRFLLQADKGDPFKPVIVAQIAQSADAQPTPCRAVQDGELLSNWKFRLHFVPPPALIDDSKLAPWRNACRTWTMSEKPLEVEGCEALCPTPEYNAAILDDCRMRLMNGLLVRIANRFDNFRPAALLLRRWAAYNGWATGWHEVDVYESRVTGFVLTAVLAHVCEAFQCDPRSSAVRLFRRALLFLKSASWRDQLHHFGQEQPVEMPANAAEMGIPFLLFRSVANEDCYCHNIFARLSFAELEEVAYVAAESVRLLELEGVECFSTLFGTSAKLPARCLWDVSVTVSETTGLDDLRFVPAACNFFSTDSEERLFREQFAEAEKPEYADLAQRNPCARMLSELLPSTQVTLSVLRLTRRGLRDRLHERAPFCLRFQAPPSLFAADDSFPPAPTHSWSLDADVSSLAALRVILGVRFAWQATSCDSVGQALFRRVDRGCLSGLADAEYYRNFFPHAQTREFKDGTCWEAVVWETPTAQLVDPADGVFVNEKLIPAVPLQILRFVFNHHWGQEFVSSQSKDAARQEKGRFDSGSPRKIVARKRRSQKAFQRPLICLEEAPLGMPHPSTVVATTPSGASFLAIGRTVGTSIRYVKHPSELANLLKQLFTSVPDLPVPIKDFVVVEDLVSGYCQRLSLNRTPAGVSVGPVITVPCFVTFATSYAWPRHPRVSNLLKASLLIQLQRQLLLSGEIQSATLGGLHSGVPDVDAAAESQKTLLQRETAFLDVQFNGHRFGGDVAALPSFIFRVHVFQAHEYIDVGAQLVEGEADITTLRSSLGPDVFDRNVNDLRRFWWRPQFNSLVAAATAKFPSFAGAVTLTKAWLCSGFFPLDHFSDFIAAVLVAVYIHAPHCLPAPASPHLAFLRLLHFIVTKDWLTEPLILPTNLEVAIDAEERKQLTQVFATRKRNCLFWVASSLDPHCLFTTTPSLTMASKFYKFAREAWQTLFSSNKVLLTQEIAQQCLHIPFATNTIFARLFNRRPEFDGCITLDVHLKCDEAANSFERQVRDSGDKSRFQNLGEFKSAALPSYTIHGDNIDSAVAEVGAKMSSVLRARKITWCGLSETLECMMRCNPALQLADAAQLVNDHFRAFVATVRVKYAGLLELYYDSSHYPYPSKIWFNLLAGALVLRPSTSSPTEVDGIVTKHILRVGSAKRGSSTTKGQLQSVLEGKSGELQLEYVDLTALFSDLKLCGAGLVLSVDFV